MKTVAPVSEVKVQNLFSLLDTKRKVKKASSRSPARLPPFPDERPQEEKKPASSSKKSSKSVELDEKLWSQTQISVASWADCDDEEEGFDSTHDAGAPPSSLGGASARASRPTAAAAAGALPEPRERPPPPVPG